MTNRKFYKTTVPLEFLSEEPLGEQDIEVLLEDAKNGPLSMRVLESTYTILDGKEASDALKEQASDPGFFQLTDDGEDEKII